MAIQHCRQRFPKKWGFGQISSPGLRHLTGTRLTSQETEMAHSSKISDGLYFAHAASPSCPLPFQYIFPSPLCFPSDVPGGFSVIQGEEPREGGRLNLTCVANKYLYTALSWRRVNDGEDAHSHDAALGSHQLTSGEFSNFLVLSVNNLTARHSGVYRCSAHHRITGQETHLDTRVAVISKWCSHSFSFFSNFLLDVRKRNQSSSFLLLVDFPKIEST